MKRLLCVIISFVMLMGSWTTTVMAKGNPFQDVSTSNWYYDYVMELNDRGLMVGTSAVTFSPKKMVTRVQFTAILHRLAGSPKATKKAPFKDVKKGAYYENAVDWAYENKIVMGLTDSVFGINESITREQMFTIMYRYANHQKIDTSARKELTQFSDRGTISKYAVNAIKWSLAEGISYGITDTQFKPFDTVPRAHCAAIICRFMEMDVKDKDVSNWASRVSFPTRAQIDAKNASASLRSPYMAAWLQVPNNKTYTEYTIEFKSDHFPEGSYYCLGNWYMDYSPLEKTYKTVKPDVISAYAGFQNIYDGSKIGIMSFWNVNCTDYSGKVTTIRSKLIYPANPYKTGTFGNEGSGTQCLDYYDWKESNWYRFQIKCVENSKTKHTEVEFWVCDLETNKNTKICAYDIGFGGSALKGNIAIFLENYLTDYAGEVRTMEVRNPRYKEKSTGKWYDIKDGYMYPNGGSLITKYEGSYDYGVEKGTLWIMTTGVGNNKDDSYGKHFYFK